MAISLNGIDLGSSTAASSTRSAAPTGSSAKDTANAQQPESDVSITSTAALLARLQQSLATQSPVDLKRVDSISKALAAGTYTIHPDKIANGLIHIERSLAQLTET